MSVGEKARASVLAFSIIYEDLENERRPNLVYLRHDGRVKYCTA
jgi:hypothetical protein